MGTAGNEYEKPNILSASTIRQSSHHMLKLTIWSPLQRSSKSCHNVHLSQAAVVGQHLLKTPEAQHHHNAKRESQQQPLVLAVLAEDLDGTNSTPQDGSSEECIRAGAFEAHGRVQSADTLNVHLRHDESALA